MSSLFCDSNSGPANAIAATATEAYTATSSTVDTIAANPGTLVGSSDFSLTERLVSQPQ